jgi:hypothetical protein
MSREPLRDRAHLHYPFGWDPDCVECIREKRAWEAAQEPRPAEPPEGK